MKIGISLICLLFVQVIKAKLPDNYETKLAVDKREVLWSKVKSTKYRSLPSSNPWLISSIKLMSSTWLKKSFTHQNDELPRGRTKLLHTYGSVAKAQLVIKGEHEYTGILQSGGPALIRLSLAKIGGSYTPGMAIKFLIDHKPSVNLHIMHSLDGQGNDHNFFKHTFTNDLKEPRDWFLKTFSFAFHKTVKKLKSGSSPFFLPITHIAKVDNAGNSITPNYPRIIEFTPNPNVEITSDEKTDHRESLNELEAGATLYSVWVKKSQDSEREYIGDLVLESSLIASEYGDEKLFFKHNIE